MIKAEAVVRLTNLKANALDEMIGNWPEDYEAIDMAIEALKTSENPIICPRCGRTFGELEGRIVINKEKLKEMVNACANPDSEEE